MKASRSSARAFGATRISAVSSLCCLALCGTLVLYTLLSLERQESEVKARAATALKHTLRQRAEGSMAATAGLPGVPLPLSGNEGRALVRQWSTRHTGESQLAWDRLLAQPLLVSVWYEGVSPSSLSTAELLLLGWTRLPLHLGRDAGIPMTPSTGLALSHRWLAEAMRRCPDGCSLISGWQERGALYSALLRLLADRRPERALAALELLAEVGPEGLPLIEAALEEAGKGHARSLTWLALMRNVPIERQSDLLMRGLKDSSPGVRVLAALEAIRLERFELIGEVEASAQGIPLPGSEVLPRFMRVVQVATQSEFKYPAGPEVSPD